MAGMRAVHKKNGTTFKYSGDLKETIEKAEKELKEKDGTTQWLFLKWQYDNARKAFEKYNRRLEDLKDFIKLAKEELAKREEAAGHGQRQYKSLNYSGNWFASMCLEKFEHPNKSNRLCGDQRKSSPVIQFDVP